MLIDDDSVVDLEAGLRGEFGAGDGADADDDHVGVDPGSVAQHDAGYHPVSAGQCNCRSSVAKVYTMAVVQLVEDGRNLRAEHML